MAKKIMLIDDSSSVRMVAGMALKEAGYDVVEAVDGKDALDQLNGQKINMIICDVNMPIMNGIEFVKECKKIQQYKFTPIMMLTTESSEKKKIDGKNAGAKAWMTKPFQPSHLVSAVSKLVLPF